MIFSEENKVNLNCKKTFNNINFCFEHDLSPYYNSYYQSNEILNYEKIKEIFPFNCELIESDSINELDIYFIKNSNKEKNSNIIIDSINQITSIPSEKKDNDINMINKKRRGRKKLGTEEKGNHDKKTFDNRIRRVKNSLLNESRILLNGKIKSVYHFNKIPKDWELFKIDPSQARNSNVKFNKKFIQMTLKEIFSSDIAKKYHYNKDHNKILIQRLLNEEDINKRSIFENILNLKFIDELKYMVGLRPDLIQLQGLRLSEKLNQEMDLDKDYSKSLLDLMENIETILDEKKSRNKSKKSS